MYSEMTSTHHSSSSYNNADTHLDPSTWMRLFEELESEQEQMRNEINDAQSGRSSMGTRQKRQLAKKVNECEDSLLQLERSLASMERNPLKFQIGDGEVQRRKGMLAMARNTHDQLSLEVSAPTRNAGRLGAGRKSGAALLAEESDASRERSNVQIHQQQQAQMATQDEKLDGILDGVTRLKVMSGDINQELDLHANLLDELDTEVDRVDGRLQRNTKRVELVTEKSGGCCGLLIMAVLFVIIILLLVTNWGCHIFNTDKC